jgi:hypothetical protein
MEEVVAKTLEQLELGELQRYKQMDVLPLLVPDAGPAYLMLKEVLEAHLLEVNEVSHGGSVPDLLAENKGDLPVLLLDGEELAGAKQNRVLNSSLLLPAKTTQLIPVSCTERGRWFYASAHFAESGNVMAAKIRAKKERVVTQSLEQDRSFRSNQGEVWNEIERLQDKGQMHLPTSAMRDVYTAREPDLTEALTQFPVLEGQRGLLVFINGQVVGFDLLSRTAAYCIVHSKLVKSYAMDALLEKGNSARDPTKKACVFLSACLRAAERRFKSTGHGWDLRYTGKELAGSALLWKSTVFHTAFFALEKEEEIGTMRHRLRQ